MNFALSLDATETFCSLTDDFEKMKSRFHNVQDWPASEDCLYLNVFCSGEYSGKHLNTEFGCRATLIEMFGVSEKMRPVLVFIHGGGFACGSVKAYGDRGICDGLVCIEFF